MRRNQIIIVTGLLILLLVTAIAFIIKVVLFPKKEAVDTAQVSTLVRELKGDAAWMEKRPEVLVDLLTPNVYSRPQTASDEITGIVIHYVANPGSTAAENKSYFEGLSISGETYASSHFIVGLDGEIIQCIPTSEIAYASNERNHDTVSIEVCHPDTSGKFNKATYDSLVEFVGWLCGYLGVSPDNVIRHYDVTGKLCPLYYVENENEWLVFKEEVAQWLVQNNK